MVEISCSGRQVRHSHRTMTTSAVTVAEAGVAIVTAPNKGGAISQQLSQPSVASQPKQQRQSPQSAAISFSSQSTT